MSFTFSTLLSMIIINAVFVIALNQVVKTSVINYFNIDLVPSQLSCYSASFPFTI